MAGDEYLDVPPAPHKGDNGAGCLRLLLVAAAAVAAAVVAAAVVAAAVRGSWRAGRAALTGQCSEHNAQGK